jgi:hypothetical protein
MPVVLMKDVGDEQYKRKMRHTREKQWMHHFRNIIINDKSTWNHSCKGESSM